MIYFYDQGWNAYLEGQLFSLMGNESAQDGWKDCEESVLTHGTENTNRCN